MAPPVAYPVDYRVSMAHLLRVTLKRPLPNDGRFPFSVPSIRRLEEVATGAPVTFFVGDNGSGKSTLLEAIACAAELRAIGADRLDVDPALAPQRELAGYLRLAWSVRTRRGFFFRAEDFIGHLRAEARTTARILREKAGMDPSSVPADKQHLHLDEALAEPHLRALDVRSHGESFLDFLSEHIHGAGLYLLDEPESPLSPLRHLSLMSLLHEKAKLGAQLVIATHSPILLSYPRASILSFDDGSIRPVASDDVQQVRFTRDFLTDPGPFLRRVFGPGEHDPGPS